MISAIVLAGGSKADLRADLPNAVNEALIPIGKRLMIEYVVEALKKSVYIKDIIVAGPVEELQKVFAGDSSVILVSSGETTLDTLQFAMEIIDPDEEHLLITTADVPLLTGQAVDGFIDCCRKLEGELFYPIVSKELNEKKYPGVKRTYVTLKEGIFTGGNILFIKPAVYKKCVSIARELIRLRKKPLSLASLIGWNFLLRYVLGKVSIKDVEQEMSQLLGVKGVGVITPFPEIGIDVDKQSDLQLVTRVLTS